MCGHRSRLCQQRNSETVVAVESGDGGDSGDSDGCGDSGGSGDGGQWPGVTAVPMVQCWHWCSGQCDMWRRWRWWQWCQPQLRVRSKRKPRKKAAKCKESGELLSKKCISRPAAHLLWRRNFAWMRMWFGGRGGIKTSSVFTVQESSDVLYWRHVKGIRGVKVGPNNWTFRQAE
jgi:hypothetical protein